MVDFALVGCAHIHTPSFVKKLKARGDLRVRRVWDHDADRAAKNAAELGCEVEADVNRIWADGDIRAAVICAETDRHEGLVLPAAEAGKHLFVEKPLGFAAADAQRMAAAIDKAGVLFQTGYFMRSSPIHQWLRARINDGAFGTITRLRHSNCHGGALGGWFDTDWRWMADPTVAGCGGFGDLGTHSLDILMWLMGDVERVTGDVNVVINRYDGCDESGEALIRFKNGAVATLAAGWVDVANPHTALVSGTEGFAHVVNGRLYAKGRAFDGEGKDLLEITDLPAARPHAFDLFLDAVVTGNKDKAVGLVTPTEAAQRNVVMQAIYEAARRRTWVDVGP